MPTTHYSQKKSKDSITIVLVYVDDIIITGNNLEEIKSVKTQLKNKFEMKDLGHLNYFVGIEVAY